MYIFYQNLFLFSIYIVNSIESASIHKQNDTLDVLKSDVSQVSSAIENFTFDMLRQMIEDSNEETVTSDNQRSKRSLDDSIEEQVQHLCQRRCEETQRIENQQINDLKNEVKKLQDVVRLLQDQQKIIDILDKENSTSERSENTSGESATGDLSKMKIDLKKVIDSLNQTKEIIDLQKKKDEILELELAKQREEIVKLKTIVAGLDKNSTVKNRTKEPTETKLRRSSSDDSELSGFRRLLKSLPEGDDDLRVKILDLQKALIKKKRDETLASELKNLEKSLKDDDGGDKNLLRLIIDALKKTEPTSRTESSDITNLSELSEAINRLRPKEDDSQAEFQGMLNALLSRPTQQQQQQHQPLSINPQQLSELTKKLTPDKTPYICIVDDGGVKTKGYRVPYIYDSPKNQFFPGQYPQPAYYPPRGVDGPSYEKPTGYQPQNGDFGQYQEDLKQQIEGLQAAVDGLNRPEYLQRPEDQAMMADLEQQIGDLRNVVNNLNGYQRTRRSVPENKIDEMTNEEKRKLSLDDLLKALNNVTNNEKMRSLDNNLVEDSAEVIQDLNKMANKFLNMTDDERRNELNRLNFKVKEMKKQLNPSIANSRAASYPPTQPQSYAPDLSSNDLKRSFKTDFLSQIIEKVLEKVINAIPLVVQRLFSFSLEEISKYDPQDYDLQVLSKNLGVFAYLPIILVRLLKGAHAFMSLLRKNSFFKNFLVPAVILGTVAGSVLFLIWWLQPDDVNYAQYGYLPGYADPNQYPQTQYPSNQYPSTQAPPSQYPASSYNYPVYNRSYFNK